MWNAAYQIYGTVAEVLHGYARAADQGRHRWSQDTLPAKMSVGGHQRLDDNEMRPRQCRARKDRLALAQRRRVDAGVGGIGDGTSFTLAAAKI